MLRRSFLLGIAAAVAAPAIIRPGVLMPVKRMLSDGVALTCIPHPHEPMVDVWNGVHYERWPQSMMLLAYFGDREIGVVVGRDADSALRCGDIVALRGSGGTRHIGHLRWLQSMRPHERAAATS